MAMSLFNSASEQLVLSQPQILNETQDDMSVYLKELLDLGLSWLKRDVIVSRPRVTRLGTTRTFYQLSLPLTAAIHRC